MLSALLFLLQVISDDLLSPSPYREITEAEHYELVRASREAGISRVSEASKRMNCEAQINKYAAPTHSAHGALTQIYWGCE